jgi:hypothetical protein
METCDRPKAQLAPSDEERVTLSRLVAADQECASVGLAATDRAGVWQVVGPMWNLPYAESDAADGGKMAFHVDRRLQGLVDEERPAAPRKISDDHVEDVVVATLEKRPRDATHWSRASMADGQALGAVHFIAKVWDVVGRTWTRPERAVVLRCEACGYSRRRIITARGEELCAGCCHGCC